MLTLLICVGASLVLNVFLLFLAVSRRWAVERTENEMTRQHNEWSEFLRREEANGLERYKMARARRDMRRKAAHDRRDARKGKKRAPAI